MSQISQNPINLTQRAFTQPGCFPSSPFVEFRKGEIEQSIPQRFEQVAANYPDQIAVKTRTTQVTYEELNRAANRLARAILAKRGETQEPVAVIAEHGAPTVIAFLGVLKSGKIFVPLDPSWPRARLEHLLRDSQASLVISHSEAINVTGDLFRNGLESIDVDSDCSLPSENVGLSLGGDTQAIILYTSGSTGEPKGVVQNHRNLLFETARLTNSFCISRVDRMSHLLSCSAAGGVREILSALLNGGSLYPFNIKTQGIKDLASSLIDEKITVCRFVSTGFRTFVASLSGQEKFPDLRVIYMGGETVYKSDLELHKQHFSSGCIFVNVYGATETGICLQYFADKASQTQGVNVPLGFPSDGLSVMLLDENGCQVENGKIGEIAVESPYLALGYWRKPALTRAAFLVEKERNTRIYRTGDLGRRTDDGSIEYFGRKDFQAEIRGHRVEVAEVEKTLLSLQSIKEAVVVARDDFAGEQALVAYVVAESNCTLAATTLRRTLCEQLPDYMVPSAFVFMDALPLAGIGKVDRRALPPPNLSRSEPKKAAVAARDPVESQLALMWQALLGVAIIGVFDDFFDLGGHSLIAAQLVARIDLVFHKRLSPAVLSRAPTIEQLANILRHETWPESWSSLTPIQPRGSRLPFFWIHGDESYGFLPRYLGPDQPLYALEHQSQDGKPARYTDVETIAAHYLEEIRTVQSRGPYFLGGYSFGGTVAFEIAQQLKRHDEAVALLFVLDSHFPDGEILNSSPGSRNSVLVRDEVHRHLYNLAMLGFREKLTYVLVRVLGKVREKINARTAGIRKNFKKVVCQVFLAMGRRVPLSFRSFYILGIYHQALRNYVPQPYSGSIVYIKSEARSSEHRLKWGRLIAGGMEVHEVPGDHLDVVKESYAHEWAKSLRVCLHKAQGTDSDNQR